MCQINEVARSMGVKESGLMPAKVKGAVSSTKRLKLSAIAPMRHCMIIGTCLTVSEARKLATRAGFACQGLSDYQVHSLTVQHVGDKKSRISGLIHKYLDKKFHRDIEHFAAARDPGALRALWAEQAEHGAVAGAVWAVNTHPCLDDALDYEVFGAVHMMSHLAGRAARREHAHKDKLRTQVQELEKTLHTQQLAEQSRREKSIEQINQLKEEVRDLRVALNRERQENNIVRAQKGLDQELAHQKHLAGLQNTRIARLQDQVCELAKENSLFKNKINQLEENNEVLERELESLLPCHARSADCSANLRGRCILYLGGHNHLCQRFRNIVEAKQGEFLHHDGGREQQLKQLQGLVQKADVIFCPTEQISHNAMYKARKICRDNPGKPMIFLDRPSVSAFIQSLNKVSAMPTE